MNKIIYHIVMEGRVMFSCTAISIEDMSGV